VRVCIHRGAEEIGGTCIELEAEGARIVLDLGLPLDAELGEVALPAVPGLAAADPSLLGVVISHPHQDHYGLAHLVPRETRFLVGRAAAALEPLLAPLLTPLLAPLLEPFLYPYPFDDRLEEQAGGWGIPELAAAIRYALMTNELFEFGDGHFMRHRRWSDHGRGSAQVSET